MLSRPLRTITLVACLVLPGAAAFAADAKSKHKVLIDFTKQGTEIDGGIPKPVRKYDYSFETWNNKLVFIEGKGILVPALPGRGGFGKEQRLPVGTATSFIIEFAVLPRNEAETFTVSFVDSDGTDVSWQVTLKDQVRGVPLSVTLPFDKPSTEDKPGKKPGFDPTKMKTWQIKGNWTEAKTEIVLIKLLAAAP